MPDVKVREHPAYKYPEDCDQISGFGGGYEQTCRNMVVAGMEWWEAHPTADPQFHGYKGVYGLINEDNEDAKALSAAVVAGANGDCTGAMHQASISHIFFAHKNGWPEYIRKMMERREPKPSGPPTP